MARVAKLAAAQAAAAAKEIETLKAALADAKAAVDERTDKALV